MRVYTLTQVGKAVATGQGNGEEMDVLRYMYANKRHPITDDELIVRNPNAKFILSTLVKRNLVQELSS
jgi:hypothetical protein